MIGPKISWKKTLHLPQATFPARAVVADRPKYLERCTDRLYQWQRNRPNTHGRFILHDGPPYANGDLHIGHALNKILKDIICRFHISDGKKIVDWTPGWDCHGLPIELKALQEHGSMPRNDVDVRAAARKLAATTVKSQRKTFREWAVMADWENAWTTMDKGFEIRQLEVFLEMVKKGLIYQRFKPVYWSPSSRTALAEAEIEYRDDHVSTAAYVKYPLRTASEALVKKLGSGINEVHAVIWTTTPWTLPANRAIGFHHDHRYSIVESATDGKLLIATSRLAALKSQLNERLTKLHEFSGQELVGAKYADPVFGNQPSSSLRPLLHANFVTEDSGSGLVHMAPGHGSDDYELCQKHEIPAFAPLDDDGRFTAVAYPNDPNFLLGKEVLGEGNEAVIARLSDSGCLLGLHKYTHKYYYDWRSKKPVIERATKQWFANVGSIQHDALRALDDVHFTPPSSKTRLQSFVRNRSEWCISRQRAWGVPIPVLYDLETGESIATELSVSHIISVIKNRGIDAWWTDEENDPNWIAPALRDRHDKATYGRSRDTMDVWFDSGTSWTQIKNSLESGQQVASCYVEGTDQHRGWFQSSLLTHVAFHKDVRKKESPPKAPFENLITHGFTLDEHSRKMSKSIGNVISPREIMDGTLLPLVKRKINGKWTEIRDAMGPDSLRLWVASCDYTTDVKVSQIVLQAINASLAKYRVTFKLLLGIVKDYEHLQSIAESDLNIVHKIALWQLKKAMVNVYKHCQSLEFNKAISEINTYINTDLSSFYFECIKDAAYCGTVHERLQVQITLYKIFIGLQQMLGAFTPLLIEEVWDCTPKQLKDRDSFPPGQRTWSELMYGIYGNHSSFLFDFDVAQMMKLLASVRLAQERARNHKKMGDSLQSFVLIGVEGEQSPEKTLSLALLQRLSQCLDQILVVSNVTISTDGTAYQQVEQSQWSYETECDIFGHEVKVMVYEPQAGKCVRCWRYVVPIDRNEDERICDRCERVIEDLRMTKPDLFGIEQDTLSRNAAK